MVSLSQGIVGRLWDKKFVKTVGQWDKPGQRRKRFVCNNITVPTLSQAVPSWDNLGQPGTADFGLRHLGPPGLETWDSQSSGAFNSRNFVAYFT